MALESIRRGYRGGQMVLRVERLGFERSMITAAQLVSPLQESVPAELLMTLGMVLAAMANDRRFPGPASS
jgi:hypothetical protein